MSDSNILIFLQRSFNIADFRLRTTINETGVISSEGFKGITHVQCYGFWDLHTCFSNSGL